MGCLIFHKWKTVKTEVFYASVESVIFRKDWQESGLLEFEECTKCGERRVTTTSRLKVFETPYGRKAQIGWNT